MGQYDALLKPLTIKKLTIRNRIMSTGHAPAYDENGKPKERYRAYQEEKAKGGIGLTVFGGSTGISADSRTEWGALHAADDSIIPDFALMADAVHKHGAKVMVQIAHMGKWANWSLADWIPSVAPSASMERRKYTYPKELEDWDIRRIVKDFGQAARRCKEGGLDGLEVSCHGSTLVDQFWSPVHNQRTDAYGGNLENRLRFFREALEEMRRVVGDDFPIGVRMSGDELLKEGLHNEQCVEIARFYAERGLVDFLNVSGGGSFTYMLHAQLTPNMAWPVAPYLHFASAVKAAVNVPVMQASRINDLATATRAIEDGHLDMVGMTRGHISDPHLVRKLMEGRPDDIRECVGAAYCIDRLYSGGGSLCIQNPATSRELTMPHVIPKSAKKKKVAIAGAGPGGLEAARVCAERGYDVVVFEASDRTGGQINLATKVGHRESLSGITRWLDGQVRKRGVDLRLGTPATAAALEAERADIVIVATGGRPNLGIAATSGLVTSSWDILSGKVAPAENVLVYDDYGDHQAASVAEFMADRGAMVELATWEQRIGPLMGITSRPIHIRNLYERKVVMTTDMRLIGVQREGNKLVAILRNDYTDAEEERLVDQVVGEHGALPVDELYFALKPRSTNLGEVDYEAILAGRPQTITANPQGRFALYRVGDAVSGRNIHAAIYDSLRLCKDL
ncbi:MAG: NADH:flavin oxidoreductase [Alphaproteobacteria bacterium]|nr:NADH:flavin oxidoreductase [Alphaproteobacteria bacterium]